MPSEMKVPTRVVGSNSEDVMNTTEHTRLDEARERKVDWKKWGPYLSERQWGTVPRGLQRERRCVELLHPRSGPVARLPLGRRRAGRHLRRQAAPLLRARPVNGKDPILKERLFGLTNSEGNHGEDVKEYYFYVDSTPTHSYMKYLYKYPQAAYPLRRFWSRRTTGAPEKTSSTNCSTPASSTTTGTSTSSWSTRRGRRGGHPRHHHGGQPGTGSCRTASPADAVVQERLVGVDRRLQPGRAEAYAPAGRRAARRECGGGSASRAR